ncbi:MAG: SH3 domain-containing protein [Anaerolineales bacterium]
MKRIALVLFYIIILLISFMLVVPYVRAAEQNQIPTVSIPTVTSSPSAATIVVTLEQDQINVRGGPGTEYPIVGILIAGQRVPALGRSVGGDWIEIVYPGIPGGTAWVYSPLVTVEGSLRVVEPPPTPTPKTTPTVNPTLAAQFIVEIPPTRLPTFTPPAAIVYPTFTTEAPRKLGNQLPMGLLIVGLGVVGLFGTLISMLRGR